MNLREALTSSLGQYGNWRGRAPRSEFWWFAVTSAVVLVALVVLGSAVDSSLPTLLGVAALLPPTTTLEIRRLHDTGHAGGWYVTSVVPRLSLLLGLFLGLASSAQGSNRWGPRQT